MHSGEISDASMEYNAQALPSFAGFSAALSESIVGSPKASPGETLDAVAKAVLIYPKFKGVLIVIQDIDGKLLYFGSAGTVKGRLSSSQIQRLAFRDQPTNRWVPYHSSKLVVTPLHRKRVKKPGHHIFQLIAHIEEPRPAGSTKPLRVLNDAIPLLQWAVDTAVEREQSRLQAAAMEFITDALSESRFDPNTDISDKSHLFDIEKAAQSLKEIFRADQTSIWLREYGNLYLCASSDESICPDNENKIIEAINNSMTPDSANEWRPSWLVDNTEKNKDRTEGKPAVPYQLSQTLGDCKQHCILAIPLHIGKKINGIVYLVRKIEKGIFSEFEKKILIRLTGLLGVHCSHSRWLHISKMVFHANTEAILVSCNTPHTEGPKIAYANPGALELLGTSPEKILHSDARALYSAKQAERFRESFDRARSDGRIEFAIPSLHFEEEMEDDSKVVNASYRIVHSLFLPEKVHYMVGILRDNTEAYRKSSQHKRLLDLLAAKRIAYFRADNEGYTIESSEAEKMLTGYDESTLLPDKSKGKKGLPRTLLWADTRRQKAWEKGPLPINFNDLKKTLQQLRRKDGSTLWVEGSIRILEDDEGNKLGYEGLYEDVSDRIRLQNFLDADQKKVLQGQEMMENLEEKAGFQIDYLACLGHQLQVPLALVVENLRNLQLGYLQGANLHSRLDSVIGEVNICAMMSKTLADMDRILNLDIPNLHRTNVNMFLLIAEMRNNFRKRLDNKSIELIYVRENIEKLLTLPGDRNFLRQAVANLLDNAIKYSFKHTEIRITAYKYPGGHRTLEIVNEGIPILKEDHGSLFHRGFRSKAARAFGPGTGFGLWLVKLIMEAHGGNVECRRNYMQEENKTAFLLNFYV